MSKKMKTIFDNAEPGEASPVVATREADKVIDIRSPEWDAHVMSQFTPGEVDSEGRPFVAGLRRVAEQLLGEVVSSEGCVEQCPHYDDKGLLLTPAVASYKIVILWTLVSPGQAAHPRTFADCADVHRWNCEPEFARFATATAVTRAEARCYRKALRLKKPSANECTNIPLPPMNLPEWMEDNQVSLIDAICSRCNINVERFVNSGKQVYRDIHDVPHDLATQMVKRLTQLQNDRSRITPALEGYDKNWRTIFCKE